MNRLKIFLILLLLVFSSSAFAGVYVDGVFFPAQPSSVAPEPIEVGTVDVVGGTSSSATGLGLAKGNSYR